MSVATLAVGSAPCGCRLENHAVRRVALTDELGF